MAQKKSGISNAQKLGIGVGLTTAAVAAVGAYFLYGNKDAVQNRKKVKSWALKAKGDVLEALEKAEKMTQGEFNDVVAKVMQSYAKIDSVSKAELNAFKKEMGENWTDLVQSGVAKVFQNEVVEVKKGAAKAPAKKVVKEVVKKAAPVAKKAVVKKVAAKK